MAVRESSPGRGKTTYNTPSVFTRLDTLETEVGGIVVPDVTGKADKTYVDSQDGVLSAQLAEKANQTDLNTTNANVAQKRDKTVKIIGTDLDTSTDTTKIKLVNLSTEVTQAMAGTTPVNATPSDLGITYEKYARNSIGVENTKFFSLSVNLFDVNGTIDGYQLSSGVLTSNVSMIAYQNYIPITPSVVYSVTSIAGAFVIDYYDINKNFISEINIDTTTITTFTPPANAYFIRFYTFLTKKKYMRSLQIVQGATLPPYTGYTPYTIPETNIVKSTLQATDLLFTKNIFDSSGVLANNWLNSGEIENNSTYVANQNFISVFPNTEYTFSSTSSNIVVACYDKAKLYISNISVDTTNGSNILSTPSNCYYIRVYTFQTAFTKFQSLQIEQGYKSTTYVPNTTKTVQTQYLSLLRKTKNIFDKDDMVQGQGIDGSGNLYANTSLMATKHYTAVEPNITYYVTSVQGAFIFAFYDNNKTYISQINIDTSSVTTIITPVNCSYIRVCTFTTKTDYLPSLQIEKGSSQTGYESFGKYVLDGEFTHTVLKNITDRFNTIIWNSLGDSITAMDVVTGFDGYQTFIKNRLGLAMIRNYGIGGTLLSKKADDSNATTAMCVRYANMDNTADIITVMGGANDWTASIPFTNVNDKYDMHTLEGAMRTIIEGLITKYPTGHIIWLTCTPRLSSGFTSQLNVNGEQVDNNGKTIEDYANFQIQTCNSYNIPVIDCLHTVGWNRFNIGSFTASNDQGATGTPDNTHPNQLGHKRIGSIIAEGFNKFIY